MVDLLVGIALICMLLFVVFVVMMVVRLVKKQSVNSILKSLAVFVVVFAISISGARTISNSKETAHEDAVSSVKNDTNSAVESSQKTTQTQEEMDKPTEGMKSTEDYKKIVGMCVGESDKIADLSIDAEKGLININLELGDPAPITYEDLANSRISSITDELLNDKSIQNIHIDIKGIGKIELLTSDAATNEYGMKYFPIEVIDKQLKK